MGCIFCNFLIFLTWSCLLGPFSFLFEQFPAMFLYAFLWLQAFLYWFLMLLFAFVSHAIIWVVIFVDVLIYNLHAFFVQFLLCSFVLLWYGCPKVDFGVIGWNIFLYFYFTISSQVLHRFFFFISPIIAYWFVVGFIH
jgi:hypothetical protein